LLGLLEEEPDAALEWRARASGCVLPRFDGTLQLPAMGYGLRYEYGMFRQSIETVGNTSSPTTGLRRPEPWEVARPDDKVEIELSCSFEVRRRER